MLRFSINIKHVIFLLMINLSVKAQIINTELLRIKTDSVGWSGSAGLNISLIKNVKQLFKINTKIHVQYDTPKQMVLFINDISFDRADGADFINKGVQHLRYNYKINQRTAWELFLQNQYNTISKIAFRRLAGTGIRYKISKSKKYTINIGSSMMLEAEKTTEKSGFNSVIRHSNYVSFNLYVNDNMTLISTTYFQPRLDYFQDYRIAHQSALAFKINKNLRFKTAFNITYDTKPIFGIPQSQYNLTNGLVYNLN